MVAIDVLRVDQDHGSLTSHESRQPAWTTEDCCACSQLRYPCRSEQSICLVIIKTLFEFPCVLNNQGVCSTEIQRNGRIGRPLNVRHGKLEKNCGWEVDDDCVKPTCLEKSWTASLHSIFRWQWVLIFVYVYNITTLLRGGRTQNVSSIFQGVFEGGLENVYMSKVFWQLSPQKRHLGDVQRPILHLKGGRQKCTLHFGTVPLKNSIKGVVIT